MAYATPSGIALRQGDVVASIRTFALADLTNPLQPQGKIREYGFTLVVTQDCDLDQDYKARFQTDQGVTVSPDKLLFGVLACGAYPEDTLKAGTHRAQAKRFSREEWKAVKQNRDPRYQFLGYVPTADAVLVADFKDFFMVPCDFLYRELQSQAIRRIAEMDTPYREHTMQRFCWYMMRVGLPTDFEYLPG